MTTLKDQYKNFSSLDAQTFMALNTYSYNEDFDFDLLNDEQFEEVFDLAYDLISNHTMMYCEDDMYEYSSDITNLIKSFQIK